MNMRIQVIIESDSGTPELVQDVTHLPREELRPDTLGLTLGEAKALLAGVQRAMVTQQAVRQTLPPQGDPSNRLSDLVWDAASLE